MHAIALVEREDHVCVRYRLAAFRGPLADAGCRITITPFAPTLLGRLRQYQSLGNSDTVILQRTLLAPLELGMLRRHARRLIFDFDDAIWRRDSHHGGDGYSRKRLARFSNVIRRADAIVAGNEFLADRCRPAAAVVIPTCIDVDAIRPRPNPPRPSLTLVWIGSGSTLKSLESIRPTLESLGREFPGLTLRMICDRFTAFDPLPVQQVRWSAAAEAEAIASADAGIAWMPDDDWSRGKCGVKLLQYMAAGLPVIANPVGVHRNLVLPGRTGCLANTHDDWLTAVRHLHDARLRQTLGSGGRDLVCSHYSIAAGAAAWRQLLAAAPLRAAC